MKRGRDEVDEEVDLYFKGPSKLRHYSWESDDAHLVWEKSFPMTTRQQSTIKNLLACTALSEIMSDKEKKYFPCPIPKHIRLMILTKVGKTRYDSAWALKRRDMSRKRHRKTEAEADAEVDAEVLRFQESIY